MRNRMLHVGYHDVNETQLTKPSTNLDTSPKSEPALELHSRAAPSLEAHHCKDGPDAGRNSGGGRKKSFSTAHSHTLCFIRSLKGSRKN